MKRLGFRASTLLCLALGCGDDGGQDTGADTGVTTVADASTSAAESTDADTSASTSGAADSTGSAETGSLSCDVDPSCHPLDPAADRGLTSHIPLGCDGGPFSLVQTLDVAAYADPEAPRSVPLLGDLDGDGNLDLVVNFRKASVGLVFAGAGDGTFGSQPAGTLDGGIFAGGWGGDLGDFDNDGQLDVVMGDHTRGARAWTNAGNLTFTEARQGMMDGPLYSGAGLADLDGDGNLDVLFGADQFSSGFAAYAGSGTGTWTATTAPPDSGAQNIGYYAFADRDGDGDLDVFAFGKGGPGITAFVFDNEGGSFVLAASLNGGSEAGLADPVQGSVGDVDCDGDLDVAAGGTIHLAEGGSYTPAATLDDAEVSHFGDFDGDGNLDLVTHDPTVGLAVYLGDGTGAGWMLDSGSGLPGPDHAPAGTPMDEAYGIDVGDLDGNDALDIVRVVGFGPSFSVEVWSR